jgi:lipoprotein-anchoring transpeptidase ErfK/SrfK
VVVAAKPAPHQRVGTAPVASAPKDRGKAPAPGGPPPAASKEIAPTESLQQLADMAAKGGAEKEKAWGVLTRKFFTASSDAEREEVKKALGEVVGDLMFSKTPTSFAESYVVQRGDTLHDIANKYNTTVGLIRWGSQKARDIIRPGEKLKIPVGKVKLILQKSRFRLIVLFNNNYVKEYVVAIGRAEKTPNGTFIIDEKVVNPNWYAPDGKVYKYGEEKNILGTRWMRFKETSQFAGFGIHGTTQEDTVGKPASEGCIRMRNKEVEELFDVVPRGTEVVISE